MKKTLRIKEAVLLAKEKKSVKIWFICILAILCFVSVVVCTAIGTIRFSFWDTLKAMFVNDDSDARLIVWNLRLPRILTAGLVGICLSLSGCLLQSVMRNNLASPTTIGVTGGASFTAYLTLVAFPTYSYLLPVGSMLGAFLTTMLIYLLAYEKGVSPVRMILSGLAVSALFSAFNDLIRTVFADSIGNASGFLVGGLNGVVWKQFAMIAPYALVGMAICLFLPSGMNVLALGDENANALGLKTERFRFLLIVAASLLAGAAISVAGLIGFVGLIVPHIARLLVGSDHKYLLPTSALLGFLFLVVCDTLGRVVMQPGEIPVGIIVSVIGTPFFLFLLRKRERG